MNPILKTDDDIRQKKPEPPDADDLRWSGLVVPAWSEEEVAQCRAQEGGILHRHDGLWWEEPRPFFCLACPPLSPRDHRACRPELKHALLGYMHVAAPDSPSNGHFRAIVHEAVATYSIRCLKAHNRNNLRHRLRELCVRPIENKDDLLSDGYEVYISCHQRIAWGRYKPRHVFESWIQNKFRGQRRLVLGAYRDNKLAAFMFPYAAGPVVSMSYIASHSEFLKYGPNEVLYHAVLCIARQTPGITMVDWGPVSTKASLNEFKLRFGATKAFRNYTWINPLLKPVLERRLRLKYPWLGLD